MKDYSNSELSAIIDEYVHSERDGSCFEVTDITLTGNNSKFKYNHHL